MDNKVSSILKRSLKIITSYIMSLIVFCVFALPAFAIGQNNMPKIMPWISFVVFLLLFFSVYTEMRNFAHKEKRPQYNINPPPYKGLIYGLIGIIPILVMQAVILLISVPADYEAFRRRVFQLLSGPLYWIAKISGNGIYTYMIALVSIVIIAFLGYLAGYREFFLAALIRNKFGKKKIKKG